MAKRKQKTKTLQASYQDVAAHVPPGFHLRYSLCGMPWCFTSPSDTFPALLISMTETYKKFSMTSLQEVTTRKRDVYPIVCASVEHTVIDSQPPRCVSQLFLSKWAFVPKKKGSQQWGHCSKASECGWMPREAFQVPADRVLHLLGGMRPIVNWTCVKLSESAAQLEKSGGQNLKPPVKPDHRHPPALSGGTLGNSDKGAKLFVPPVRDVYFTNQLSTGAVKTFDPAGF